MWKIHYIAVFLICTVCGLLFLPLYLAISILVVVLIGTVFFHDLPLSVHVASIRLFFESFYSSAVNTVHYKNKNLLLQSRSAHSNGVLKNHVGFFSDKRTTNPNLISRNKLSNDQELIMPLHSTPIGLPKGELEKKRKSLNDNKAHSMSWGNQKLDNAYPTNVAVPRNVQTVAGPLLVSTRFNSGISAEILADVKSDGFSSRLAQRGNPRSGVTHQEKYSGIGVFPVVQLTNTSPKHSLSPRNSAAVSKTVRVRIAPPDNSLFGGLENSMLSDKGESDSMKSVLQVLKEMSRKRIHSQVDEEEDDKVKRQKKESFNDNTPKVSLDGGLQNKRGRDDSPRSSEEVKRQRRQTNAAGSNEIMSSLSSSLAVKPPHLIKGTKRKAQTVDWSRSPTPVSGKLLKTNVSPANRPVQQNSQPAQEEDKFFNSGKENFAFNEKAVEVAERKQLVDNGLADNTSSAKIQNNGNDCVRIEAGQRRVLARAGDVKEVPIQEVKMYDIENETSAYLNETTPSVSVQRIKDPGRRLKDMLAAIDGSDDIDADASDMSPSVIAILKTAKTPSRLNAKLGLNVCETPPTKSPVSILKTPGGHETNKSVTFSDQVNSTPDKDNQVPTVTSVTTLSPQTCLSTATVVSNSINTSISSASETVPFDYGGLSSTFKNANSSPSSPSLTFSTSSPSTSVILNPTTVATAAVTTTTGTSLQQIPTQSPTLFTESKTSTNTNLFNSGASLSNKQNTVQVSGPSNKFEFGKGMDSMSSGGFGFSGVQSPEATQASVLKTPVGGIFAINSNVNVKTEPCSTNFSSPATSAVASVTSVLTVTPLKPGSFSFMPVSKPAETNFLGVSGNSGNKQSDKAPAENSGKPQFGFSFGSSQNSLSNNINNTVKPSFGGFGSSGNMTAPSTCSSSTSTRLNSGVANSTLTNPQTTTPSSFMLNSTTTNNPNAKFSFGSNTSTTNQTAQLFGSSISQPVSQHTIFGNTSASTTSQAATINSFPAVSSPPTMFGCTPSSNVTSAAASKTSQSNTTPLFGSIQTTSSINTTPTFGTPNMGSFGGGSVFGSNINKPEGFGSPNVFSSSVSNANASSTSTSTPSLFNNFSSSPIQSGGVFGTVTSTVGSSFPSSSVPVTAASVFGQTASTSLFTFGSPTVTTQNSLFGGSNNSINSTTRVINGPSTFSAIATSNNNNNSTTTQGDKSKPSPFGGGFQTPSFNFGSNAPSTNSFGFGSSSNAVPSTTAAAGFNSPFKPPEQQKPFGFDAPQTTIQNSTPIFAFGQNNNSAQPAATPSFQFNTPSNSQQPASSGLFNFGAGTNPTNSPFGTGINPPTFSIGGGFSIGSGGSSTRSRIVGSRSRRLK